MAEILAAARPTPVSGAVGGEPEAALEAMSRSAFCRPRLEGANCTAIEQVLPPITVGLAQVSAVMADWPGLAPPRLSEPMLSGSSPGLVTMNVWLVAWPRSTLPYVSGLGLK